MRMKTVSASLYDGAEGTAICTQRRPIHSKETFENFTILVARWLWQADLPHIGGKGHWLTGQKYIVAERFSTFSAFTSMTLHLSLCFLPLRMQ